MTTALDLISDSLYELRVYAPGETVSAADTALALRILNRMLDQWSNESLACYAISEQSVALTIGKSQYSIGTTGTPDITATRPLKLVEGYGAAYIQDTQGNNFPVAVVTQEIWNTIGNRAVTSQIPDTLFYDPQFPLGLLNVFPTPSISYTLFWDSHLPFTQFAALTAVVSLPPGYEEALLHNLSVRLKPNWKKAALDPAIAELARSSLANIKRTNLRPVQAAYDSEIVARGTGSYNIYRDGRGSTA